MNDDPSSDPALFAGKTRLYYGRWSYKFEEAARQGAVGALDHPHDAVGRLPVPGHPGEARAGAVLAAVREGRVADDRPAGSPRTARKKLAALGGADLDALRAKAETRDFKPVPLGVKATLATTNTDPADRLRQRGRAARRAATRRSRTRPSSSPRTSTTSASARRSRATRSTTARSTTRRAAPRMLSLARALSHCATSRRAAACCSSRSRRRSRGCSGPRTTRATRPCRRRRSSRTSTSTASTSGAALETSSSSATARAR